jgi:hypothetical protein
MVVSKHIFWQAFVFTVVIFILGLAAGFLLETSRTNQVQKSITVSETKLLDEQLRNRAIDTLNISCSAAIESTFQFADSIYDEARQLEEYDSSSTFTDTLLVLHRRYDLLRTMLWLESIDLRAECKGSFHTVVYLYDYNTDDVGVRSKQLFFSRALAELKIQNPDSVLLIPIARNLGIESVRIASDRYGVTTSPSILIDEKVLVTDIDSFDEFQKLVLHSNN